MSRVLILFIPGFNKDPGTWNVTENGKEINIESSIRKVFRTVLIEINYSKTIMEMAEEIYTDYLEAEDPKTKIVIVAHSYGSFYALALAQFKRLDGLLFLDPTTKNQSYYNYLMRTKQETKIQMFDDFPIPTPLPQKTILKVFLIYREADERIIQYGVMVKNNVFSDLILLVERGHMIHYEVPDKIIHAIRDLIKKL